MRRNIILIISTIFILTACLAGCAFSKDSDKTGVKISIEALVLKSDNWKQYAQNSNFQLSNFVEDNNYSYGTYPKINVITLTLPMAAEFARQHLGKQVEKDILSFLHVSRSDPVNDVIDVNDAITRFLTKELMLYAASTQKPNRTLNADEPFNLLLLPDPTIILNNMQNDNVSSFLIKII